MKLFLMRMNGLLLLIDCYFFPHCFFIMTCPFPYLSIDYTAPWNVRYWAKDYALEAMRQVTGSLWPAGSLEVRHCSASPTHWRVVPTNYSGFQQPSAL